jgi:PBP1b-binding outer membrane lipoprotein LpoB
MSRTHAILCALAVMLISGCSSTSTKDIVTAAQADPKANFSGYKTYAWLGAAAIVNDTFGQWEPPAFDADAEIKHLIDRELSKHGMSQNSANPDLAVVFAAGINMDALELKVDPESTMEDVTNVPRGGLMIALVDGQSGFVIWAGVATAEVQQSSNPDTVKARLDYAVTQMLRKLPK